jgi:hypothetical protein
VAAEAHEVAAEATPAKSISLVSLMRHATPPYSYGTGLPTHPGQNSVRQSPLVARELDWTKLLQVRPVRVLNEVRELCECAYRIPDISSTHLTMSWHPGHLTCLLGVELATRRQPGHLAPLLVLLRGFDFAIFDRLGYRAV